MPQPLNRTLYGLLVRRFGRVRISAEGEAQVGTYVNDGTRNRLDLLNAGEYYQVCCPRCSDTRFRLYINHQWGRRAADGTLNLWLMVCYNENCWDDYERRRQFYEELADNNGQTLSQAVVSQGVVVTENTATTLPGDVVPLSQLPAHHAANLYLAGRGYDPEELSTLYGVGYCRSATMFYIAKHRIIAPIWFRGVLCGWQARHIGDLDWRNPDSPPKWFTDPHLKKTLLLYNYDQAKLYETGVIVEGAGDVWGFGPMAVATMGSSMNEYQVRLMVAAFRDKSVVFLWDPDVRKDPKKMKHMEKVLQMMKGAFAGGLAVVWLPDGYDPGSFHRPMMHEFVRVEAARQGVQVNWSLRSACAGVA